MGKQQVPPGLGPQSWKALRALLKFGDRSHWLTAGEHQQILLDAGVHVSEASVRTALRILHNNPCCGVSAGFVARMKYGRKAGRQGWKLSGPRPKNIPASPEEAYAEPRPNQPQQQRTFVHQLSLPLLEES